MPRVNAMSRFVRRLALVLVCAAGLAPATAAGAQWYGGRAGQRPPPLYPYELQPGQSYAVEVAPGTYVIHHTARSRGYRAARHRSAPAATPRPKRTHANRALIEKLRRRDARRAARHAAALKRAAARRAAKKAAKKAAERVAKRARRKVERIAGGKPDKIIRTRRVVHDKPVVIVRRRVVEDPPKVITRRHYVDDTPAGMRNVEPRVIHADAEITILGPDRMSIRLVRKQGEPLVIGDAGSKRVVMPEPNPRRIKRKRTGKRLEARQ